MNSSLEEDWTVISLGELIDLFDHVRIPLSSRERRERQGPFPYYGASGVIDSVDGYLFDGRYLLISEDGENLNSRKTPIAFFAEGKFWVNNHAHIVRAKPDVADDYFVKALIDDTDISGYISGAAQPKLTQANLRSIKVRVPSLPTQRRIADILSAYDDLIETNARRIALLEELARSLYQEWFVRFRFPGHEGVELVETEVGAAPAGWEVGTLPDIAEIDPTTRVPREGEKPFVPMSSLSNSSMLISNVESRSGNSGSKFRNGDTLFARITPCLENGKTGFVQFLPSEDAVAFGSTEFIVLRSKQDCPEFVYLLARSDDFRSHAIKSMTGATGRQRVQSRALEQYVVARPDADTLARFCDITGPLFMKVHALAQVNENLRQTRDLLLPKLISGEISVADAEETVW